MEKSFINLNDLPEMVKEGRISKSTATKLVAADVLKRPQNYRVPVSDEEVRSELSVKLIQNADYIFRHYKKELCSFRTYLCSFIKFQVMNILREKYRAETVEEHIRDMSILNYEDDTSKYEMDESAFKIGHFSAYNQTKNDKVPFKPQNYISEENFSSFFQTKPDKKVKTTLVLALKSCYYLTPEHISKISRYCGISRKELEQLVDDLKDSIKKKSAKFEKNIELRDKAFQLHMKFQKLAERTLIEEAKNEYKLKYIKQTEIWKHKNSIIKKQALNVCPTNKRLAQLLGVCERQIGYYLQQADTLLKDENID